MDCEQTTGDAQGRRWFELKAFMVTQMITAPAPYAGLGGRCRPNQLQAPPYTSRNHMGGLQAW